MLLFFKFEVIAGKKPIFLLLTPQAGITDDKVNKERAEQWSQEKYQLGPLPWIPPIHSIIRLAITSSSHTLKPLKEKLTQRFFIGT